jgi:hypothetical protein
LEALGHKYIPPYVSKKASTAPDKGKYLNNSNRTL